MSATVNDIPAPQRGSAEPSQPTRSWSDRLAPWLVNAVLLLMALMLGGGLYEGIVVDRVWPGHLAIIQPALGGLNRKLFWAPVHIASTVLLPLALWSCWRRPAVRNWLLVGTVVYVALRVWSFLYFIPLALKLELAPEMSDRMMAQAVAWVRLSPLRTVMGLASVLAFWAAARELRPAKKAYKGLPMEGFIARWYAGNTGRRRDPYTDTATAVARQLSAGASVLEVAPGPGYLAIELAKLGELRVVGLDISHTFVEIARGNAWEAGVAVTFEQGNASAMPFPPESFDMVVCRAAFKNFSEPVEALNEMHRVLKPGGRAVIYDLRPDAPLAEIDAEVRKMGLGRIDAEMTRLTFRHMLLRNAYTADEHQRMAARSRFRTCDIQVDGIGLAVTLQRPAADSGPAVSAPTEVTGVTGYAECYLQMVLSPALPISAGGKPTTA